MKRVKIKNNEFLDSNYVVHGRKSLSKVLELLDKLKFINISVENKDLNTLTGEFIIGYGNECANRPADVGNGYFINIPHSSSSNAYNKQVFMPRTPNEIWVRNQENGIWSEWDKI